MTGTTISGAYFTPVTLSDAVLQNPAAITSGATISASGTALIGESPTAWTIANYGLVEASGGDGTGIYLASGGTILNQSSGTITGTSLGITLAAGGYIANQAGGYIGGSVTGVVVSGGAATLLNAGTIAGSGAAGYAVTLATGFADRLIVDPGAVFIGTVSGGNPVGAGAISTLELASGASAGALSGLGSDYIDFAQVTIDAGATWAVAGNVIGSGVTLTNLGDVTGPLTLAASGVLTNASGGTITGSGVAAVYGYGGPSLVVNAGAIADAAGYGVSLGAGGTVTNASGGTITGYLMGALIYGATGTVVNDGSVAGGMFGAVELQEGGQVTNQGSGVITGYGFAVGVGIFDAAGTLSNFGSIAANFQAAVVLENGGEVTNQPGGTITGYTSAYYPADGVIIENAPGTVTNFADITSSGASAIFVFDGQVTNQSGGTVVGQYAGVMIGIDPTVVNAGSISGSNAAYGGVVLKGGGQVTNQGTGAITGYAGADGVVIHTLAGTVTNFATIASTEATAVYLAGGGSVTNQSTGTITGAADAVLFAAGSTNRLVIDPGAVFGGTVDGGNAIGAAAISTLELASGATTGTLSGLGSKYIDFANVTIDPGASWTLTGGNSLAAGATLNNAGTLTLSDATLTAAGTVVNNGEIAIDPSTLTVGALIGAGTATIDAGGTLDALGTIAGGETVMFAGSGAYLDLASPGSIAGSVTNFAFGDTIDLTGIAPDTVSYSSGEVHFNGDEAFALGLANGNTLQIGTSSDGTELTALCFCHGTMIATPSGHVKVQNLAAGDLVRTWRGAARPIAWIGTGAVLATRGRRNAATPVIVRKGALADNVPTRDLRLTKGHALYVDGALIPVEFLVNHRSIAWDDRAQEVKLYHIELATHDLLIANGAPAESYRDDGNRWLFRNANSGWHLPPQQPCAPVLTGGAVVDALWRRLLMRAGPRPGLLLTEDPDLHLLVDGDRLPAESRHGAHLFRLPPRPSRVRIVSRAAAPAELGLARDPRVLGVAVQRIALRQGTRFRVMDASDASLAQGFHAFEPDLRLRWTDGDAGVPAALFDGFDGPTELMLHLACTTQYALFADAKARAAG